VTSGASCAVASIRCRPPFSPSSTPLYRLHQVPLLPICHSTSEPTLLLETDSLGPTRQPSRAPPPNVICIRQLIPFQPIARSAGPQRGSNPVSRLDKENTNANVLRPHPMPTLPAEVAAVFRLRPAEPNIITTNRPAR